MQKDRSKRLFWVNDKRLWDFLGFLLEGNPAEEWTPYSCEGGVWEDSTGNVTDHTGAGQEVWGYTGDTHTLGKEKLRYKPEQPSLC